MLLPVPAVRGGRTDPDERALPELHLSQPDVDVLPQSLSLHQASGQELYCREKEGPVLSHNHLSAR